MNTNPVYRREMMVSARSMRTSLIIAAFNLVLAAFVLISMVFTIGNGTGGIEISYATFLYIFRYVAAIEFTLIVIITPALTSGSISGERERHTLDLMLTTRIRPFDLAAGKLMGALYSMLLIVFSSLPILTLVLAYGGVTVTGLLLLLMTYAVTALFCACIGICVSSFCRTTGAATVITYLVIGAACGGLPALLSLLSRYGEDMNGVFALLLADPLATFYVNVKSITGSSMPVQEMSALFGMDAEYPSLRWVIISTAVQAVISVCLLVYASTRVLPHRKKKSGML